MKLVDGTLNGSTGIASGNGVHGASLRVTIASDSTGQVALAAGANAIGSVSVTGSVAVTSATFATVAKQPALGTAGTASTDVISVQGIASMTPFTVTAASLPLPTGAATSAAQTTAQATLTSTDASNTLISAAVAIPTTVYNGKTTVTTAGTRVVLSASQVVKSVTIKALTTNVGTIYVGSSTVSSTNGFQLAGGETVSIDLTNLNTINIDSSVNLEGVTYLGVG